MSADSGGAGAAVDEDTRQRMVESVKNGNQADVVDILDRIGWDVGLGSCSFPFSVGQLEDTGTLLHVACCFAQPALVKLFLERGANPDEKSRARCLSALHVSAARGDEESCAVLISSGCLVDAVDVGGETPLHRASRFGMDCVVRLLLRHGADANRGDHRGRRPLHSASLAGPGSVQLLVKSGAFLNCQDSDGKTPLHLACIHEMMQIVECLARLGANINITDKNQRTALHYAVTEGNLYCARALISSLPDANTVQEVLKMHLHIALKHSSLALLSFVSAYGALEKASQTRAEVVKLVAKSFSPELSDDIPVHEILKLALACQREGLVQELDKRSVQISTILVAAGALDNTTRNVIADIVRLAVDRGSVELALALCQTNASCGVEKEFLRDVLELSLNGKSVSLALAVCRSGALAGAGPQIVDKVLAFSLEKSSLDLALVACRAKVVSEGGTSHLMQATLSLALSTASVQLATAACVGGALDSASPTTLHEVLLLGLASECVGLATIACKQGALNTARTETLSEALHLGLASNCAALAAIACKQGALNDESGDILQETLHLALDACSVELATIACHRGALGAASLAIVNDALLLGLKSASVDLTTIACRCANTSLSQDIVQAILQLALSTASVDLAVVACQQGALKFVSSDLAQAVLLLSLNAGSIDLAIIACQEGALDTASSATVGKLLHLILEYTSIETLVAVASKAIASAAKTNQMLLGILEFAVQQALADLAIMAGKAGAILLADHQLLTRAMEMAIETSSNTLLLILCEADIFQQCEDRIKEVVLRKAAMTGDMVLADLCVSGGALHRADQWDIPTPIDIATNNRHRKVARRLKKSLNDHKLLSLGQRDANTVLIRVVGSPGAGKGTLVKSLKTSRLRGFFRWESQDDEGDRKSRARTRGIQVDSYVDRNGTLYRILDFGGLEDFTTAYKLFFGEVKIPVINIITISLLQDLPKMTEEVLKWSAFFASRNHRELHRDQLMVVMTRSDRASEQNRLNAAEAVHRATSLFGGFLEYHGHAVFVDARKSWNREMVTLRRLLAGLTKQMLIRAPPEPALCKDILKALPRIRAKADRPFVTRNQLPELIAQALSSWRRSFDKGVLESHTDLLNAVLQYISDTCEIVSFEIPDLKDLIVIRPPWVLRDVAGVLLSPWHYPPPRALYDDCGRSKRKQVEAALEATYGHLVDPGASLQMVAQLGMCILDEGMHGECDDEEIFVPSMLSVSRHLQAILSTGNPGLGDVWFGIELQCHGIPLSVCFFPQLQVYLHQFCLRWYQKKPTMWSGGFALSVSHGVVAIVEAKRSKMAIDVIVRGTEATRRTCFTLLQMLKDQVLLKVEEVSPGSELTEKILSSRELSSLDWSKSEETPRITYEREEVEKAMMYTGIIRPRHGDEVAGGVEDAFNLMAVSPTHVSLMTIGGYDRFCNEMNLPLEPGQKTPKCHQLALRLNSPDHQLLSWTMNPNPTGAFLQWWSRCSGQHTVERLLPEVKELGNYQAAAILENELAISLHILPEGMERPAGRSSLDADDSHIRSTASHAYREESETLDNGLQLGAGTISNNNSNSGACATVNPSNLSHIHTSLGTWLEGKQGET